MRFLLDTNILIPLEDSKVILEPSLTNLIRLAMQNRHDLLYHPASERDIARDTDAIRREQTLTRITRYQRLNNPPPCPWNTDSTNDNDACDNDILFALERNAVHALVTEDRDLHTKAKARGLQNRVYYIQTAEEWLKRLHSEQRITLPNIHEANLYELIVDDAFFDSLRTGYNGFNEWFARASRSGRRAWVYGSTREPQAICIYDTQVDETVTDCGKILSGKSLKLCTFKVAESVRGRKIGELFLKAAFRYATDNRLENIFITTLPYEQHLVDLLHDFGFEEIGQYNGDTVYVKSHPVLAPVNPAISAFEYHRLYFPHYRHDNSVKKFIVPIQPIYHQILFPEYQMPQLELPLVTSQDNIGNAIKLAYLSHAQVNNVHKGDIILFYRSMDLKSITSIAVVEDFMASEDEEEIARMVSRRTVYNMNEISIMAEKITKVILFRLTKHFHNPVNYVWLKTNRIVTGPIQTIRTIDDMKFDKIIEHAD